MKDKRLKRWKREHRDKTTPPPPPICYHCGAKLLKTGLCSREFFHPGVCPEGRHEFTRRHGGSLNA